MNSESIKALIELFGNLGASSKEAFLWYIGLQVLQNVLCYSAIFAVIIAIYRLIKKGMSCSLEEKALIKLRDAANLGEGILSSYEIDKVLEHYLELEKKRRGN